MHKVLLKKVKRVWPKGINWRIAAMCVALIFGAVLLRSQDAKGEYCLAHLIYVEARGMSTEAQYDVAQSVMNRVRANRAYFGGNTVCGVVFHIESGARQFSGVVEGEWVPKDKDSWWRSLTVAERVMSGKVAVRPEVKDALYYMNPNSATEANKRWFREHLRETGRSGAHVFYTDR